MHPKWNAAGQKAGCDLRPNDRVLLPNSRAVVRITVNRDGVTYGVREWDGMLVQLTRTTMYTRAEAE